MSLSLRLTLTYVLVTLAGLLLLGGSFIALVSSSVSRQNQQELVAQTTIFAELVTELADSPAELQALAPGLATSAAVPPGVTARIFASNGTLLSSQAGLGPFPSRPVRALLTNQLPLPISQVADRRYAAQLIPDTQAALGVVEFSRSTASETALLGELRLFLFQASLLAALLMLLISVWLARSIARPLVRLTTYAEAVATGSGLATVPAIGSGIDEVRRLEDSLGHMAGQLQARLAEARRDRKQLELVLAGITEGVVALDRRQNVVFANQAARVLLEAGDNDGLTATLRALQLTLPPHESLDMEFEHRGRILNLRIDPVPPETEYETVVALPVAVLVLRDISRLKELEQARSRFFRSVSHDLRTPLTAIRGTIENLRDTAAAEEQAALMTLESEALRLSRLVDELLNPPESGLLVTSDRSRIDLAALLQEMSVLQLGRARRAGVNLSQWLADGTPAVVGDRDRLKQALLNLIDNALKMTAPGGKIELGLETVTAADGRRLARMIVADSGPGVPPEERERIWERGIRNAEYGGSGLGLAIVREIAQAHGGRAWVEANQPVGARFILELPAL